MNIKRHVVSHFLKWKTSSERKPLILRGARQVGKTTVVKQFAKTYKHTIYLNLELVDHRFFFKAYSDARTITEALFITFNISSKDKNETLLFIDEIQESPEAIAMLRYFYEMEPELHVMAAGSLLEHAMRKVKSFPVGRVQMMYLHPVNFPEFLLALGKTQALESLNKVPISQAAHQALLDLFNRYAIIGGMPEVIKKYVETQNIADLAPIYTGIWHTYKEDVEKYATNASEARIIKHIMATAHFGVDQRIKFQNFGNSNYRSREVGEAFRNLDDAKVIQLIYPTTDQDVPVQIDLKKSPRMQFLDTGLINNELNIQAEMLAMDDLSTAYKGAIIPHLIAQELMSLNVLRVSRPVFWVREKRQSSAEVDLVVQFKSMVIPIEIKSGKQGKLKSLQVFIDAAPHPYAVRLFAGEFSIEPHTTSSGKSYFLMNLPYYCTTQLFEYLAYFISSHP